MGYIAKVKGKTNNDGRFSIIVDFIDGDHIVTESCTPQDKGAFNMWVKSRLAFLDSAKELDAQYKEADTIEIIEPIIKDPKLTQAEINRNTWLNDYTRWLKIKTTLIDTDILLGTETPLVNLRNKVKNNFIADYINYI
jgi:hypothetical protein